MGLTDRKKRKRDKERKNDIRTSDATNSQKKYNDQHMINNVVTDKESPVNAVGIHSTDYLAIVDRNEILRNREISIQCLDDFSTLLDILTPSQLYYSTLTHSGLPAESRIQPHVNAVQIHFINNHYVVSAQTNGVITVYDSIPNSNRVNELLEQLRILYVTVQHYRNPVSQIKYIIPQCQGPTSDCGVFACANAQLLQSGIDPCSVVLDQSKLRNHVYFCLNKREVYQLPIIHRTIPTIENVKTNQFNYLEKSRPGMRTDTMISQLQPIYADKEPSNNKNKLQFTQSRTECTDFKNKTKSKDSEILFGKREATRQRVQKKRNDPVYSKREKETKTE